MTHKILAATGLLASCSMALAQGTSPFGTLTFDLNGLGGTYYSAAGGGGAVVPGLDPSGASAAGGSSPFSGSLVLELLSSSFIGATGGNNTNSLFGPFAPAGDPGSLQLVSGFVDFSNGFAAGGQLEFANAAGDSLTTIFDASHAGPLNYAFGNYDVATSIESGLFADAGGDGFFGAPGTGVDISKFLGGVNATGVIKFPLIAAGGANVDADVTVQIPAPASALLLGGGIFAISRRRR